MLNCSVSIEKKSSDMLEENMTVRRFLEEYYQKVMKLVPVPFYGLKVLKKSISKDDDVVFLKPDKTTLAAF